MIAEDGERPVACGAMRRLLAPGFTDAGEIKRMYTAPEARGHGLGRLILERLEAEAIALGLSRLLLETGERQHEALALYRHFGFVVIAPYGEYVGSPLSVCMEKRLT